MPRSMMAFVLMCAMGCGGGAASCPTASTTAGAAEAKPAEAERMKLLESAKIEVADAIKAALERAPGRVLDTELRSKNGKTVWEVDVASADGKSAEVDVDATSGQVVDSE